MAMRGRQVGLFVKRWPKAGIQPLATDYREDGA